MPVKSLMEGVLKRRERTLWIKLSGSALFFSVWHDCVRVGFFQDNLTGPSSTPRDPPLTLGQQDPPFQEPAPRGGGGGGIQAARTNHT